MKLTKWTIAGLTALGLAVMLVAVWPVQSADVLRLPGATGSMQQIVTSGVGEAYADITNNTPCAMTGAFIMCHGGKEVAVQWRGQLSGAGTTANTLTIQKSVDALTWEAYTAIVMTPAGTDYVTVVTNLSVGSVPYLRVSSIANANANTGYITNYTVKAFVK